MKRIFISIIMSMVVTLCLAQDYEPTTTWPYLYDDFTAGVLTDKGGASIEGLYNIHILHGRLHFIEGDMIKEAKALDVVSVKIGDDVYRNVGGTLMQVLARSDKGYVVRKTEIDAAAMNATGGAYGASSSTLATQALSSLEFMGSGSGPVNHMNMKSSKNDGKTLPLIVKTYLVFDYNVVFAAKRDVLAVDGVDKGAVNAFIKENKIKWKDPQSLIKLVDFISKDK